MAVLTHYLLSLAALQLHKLYPHDEALNFDKLPKTLLEKLGPTAERLWDLFLSDGRLRVCHLWRGNKEEQLRAWCGLFQKSLDHWVVCGGDNVPTVSVPVLANLPGIVSCLDPDFIVIHDSHLLPDGSASYLYWPADAPLNEQELLAAFLKAYRPQVSVLTCKQASDRWLKTAYSALLGQTLRRWQWIIRLNPDSKFDVRDPRVVFCDGRYLDLVEKATADYITLLDPPALPTPELLQSQVDACKRFEPVRTYVCCLGFLPDGRVVPSAFGYGMVFGRTCHREFINQPPVGPNLFLNPKPLVLLPQGLDADDDP